jgi:hypothetical protein
MQVIAERKASVREFLKSSQLREEIEHAKKDLVIARQRYDMAAPDFVDSAAALVTSCELRLDALMREAKRNAEPPMVKLKTSPDGDDAA